MKIYLVGGAVRDHLLGIDTQDRDWVVVGATVEEMLALGFKPIGKDFPVFIHPESKEEYALARSEKKIGKGYHGFTFYTDPTVSLEDDLLRRDLTINAMAMDEHGNIIDPFHGRQDLKNRILKHVSPAFSEDPVRVLRLARFIAKFGFTVDIETANLVVSMVDSGELDFLVRDRVWKEFSRGLLEKYAYQMLVFLYQFKVLKTIFPDLDSVFSVYRVSIQELFECPEFVSLDLSQRLTILISFFTSEGQVTNFFNSLSLPKRIFNYGVTFYRIFQLVSQNVEVNSEIILTLFEIGDAFRQSDRFTSILNLLKLMINYLQIETNLFDKDLYSILSEIKSIDFQELINKHSREEIHLAIRKKRLKKIEALV